MIGSNWALQSQDSFLYILWFSDNSTKGEETSNLESKLSGEPLNIRTSTSAASAHPSDNAGLELEENQKPFLKVVDQQQGTSVFQQNFLLLHMKNVPGSIGGNSIWMNQNDVLIRDQYIIETNEVSSSNSRSVSLPSSNFLAVSFTVNFICAFFFVFNVDKKNIKVSRFVLRFLRNTKKY